MIPGVESLVGSAAAGSVLKIAAGTLQNFFDTAEEKRQARHRERLAELHAAKEAYEVQTSDPATRRTRRTLAFGVCGTFCLIAIYCTLFPDIPLHVIPVEPGKPETMRFLWGLFERTIYPSVEAVAITTGTLAYAAVQFSGMILGFYFTPIGKR